MSQEESEFWGKVKQGKKEKKWQNEKQSLDILRQRGIPFKILSEASAHYRVGDYDFWPTTGKFINQRTQEKGRGVFNLLKRLNYEPSQRAAGN